MLIDASDFALVGDGVSDDTTGLRRLRDHIRGLEDRPIVVDFEPGHYLYTDNTWWKFGERDVTLRFNGARVENVSQHAWTRSFGLLPTSNNPHEFSPDDVPFSVAETTVPAGTRFHSADASAQEIDLFTPLPLVPGEVVLLTGLIQQIREVDGVKEGWGWPPNCRFYEYQTVESVDGTVVRFTERLRHAYDETWPDWQQTPLTGHTNLYGAARLFLTHGTGWRQLRSLRVHGAAFVANRNKTPTALGFTGRKFELIGCRTEGEVHTSMSHVEDFTARDCDLGYVEVDKINRRVSFDRCRFRGPLFSGRGRPAAHAARLRNHGRRGHGAQYRAGRGPTAPWHELRARQGNLLALPNRIGAGAGPADRNDRPMKRGWTRSGAIDSFLAARGLAARG